MHNAFGFQYTFLCGHCRYVCNTLKVVVDMVIVLIVGCRAFVSDVLHRVSSGLRCCPKLPFLEHRARKHLQIFPTTLDIP